MHLFRPSCEKQFQNILHENPETPIQWRIPLDAWLGHNTIHT